MLLRRPQGLYKYKAGRESIIRSPDTYRRRHTAKEATSRKDTTPVRLGNHSVDLQQRRPITEHLPVTVGVSLTLYFATFTPKKNTAQQLYYLSSMALQPEMYMT